VLVTLANSQSNPIPGWDYMFAGYDIRNASTVLDGIKYPLFMPTYTFGQKFYPPNSTVAYDVPDQMYAYGIYETDVLTTTDIYQDVTAMITEEISSFSFGIGFNLGLWGIDASVNRTAGDIHSLFKETDHFGAKGHLDSKTTKFVIGPYQLFTLNPYFNNLINTKIPQCPKTAADLANVDMMIKIWGQVFPTSLFMGGRFDVVTSLDDSLVQKYDKSWVFTQLTLKFTYDGFSIYGGGFANRSDINVSKIFEESTSTSMFFIGGERALQTNTTEVQWFESIDAFPEVIYGSFDSISELATDTVKQRNLLYMLTNQINTGSVSAPPCAYLHTMNDGSQLPPIPGYEFVGSGYDSLTLSVKGFVIDTNTYSQGQSWTNPFYPTYSYAVPDNLYLWPQTEHFEQNFTSIAMSDSEFLLQLSNQVSGSSWFGFAKHSAQMSIYQYYHELHDYDQSQNTRTISWYDLELNPVVEALPLNFLTPWASDLFSNLGTDITNPTVYQGYINALNAYGDSLVRRVSVGGSFYFQAFLNNDTVDEITTEKFNEQSSWSFLGIFGGKSDWDYYNSAVSDVVKANTVVNIQVKGGTWNPQAFSYMQKTGLLGNYQFDLKDVTDGPILDWDTFALSVKDNMVPIHYELIPMYTIFSDPVISNNFKTVTQQWINSRLKERADVRPRWV
jgi:hypothetical protein